ncbi:unnamed protein product, partial [Polarella glacialis]
METIEIDLRDYLETKRMAFPRLYFVSREDLLSLLARGRDPATIEQHICVCFDAVRRLDFAEDRAADILGFVSAEEEHLVLNRVKIRVHAEETLDALQSAMLQAIRRALKSAVEETMLASISMDGPVSLAEWAAASDLPAQAVLVGWNIAWAYAVEKSLGLFSEGKPALAKEQVRQWQGPGQFAPLLAIVRGGGAASSKRWSACALLIVMGHGRDVLQELLKLDAPASDSFEWDKQLRYSWEQEEGASFVPSSGGAGGGEASGGGGVVVRQQCSRFAYGLEYVGASSRLVLTPQTERCWLAITQAFHRRLGV